MWVWGDGVCGMCACVGVDVEDRDKLKQTS